MKELDFLPDWYKEGRRRQSHMRRQYIALVLVFLAMMTFNLTATHRAGRAAAELAGFEEQRVRAEDVVHQFNLVTAAFNELKTRADRMERMDSKIDIAAVLAEMSYLVEESVVLSKVEFVSEPFRRPDEREKGGAIRATGTDGTPNRRAPLGNTRFRIVLSGVAAHPSHVADLVCRLDESSYFHRVYPSFSRNTKIQVSAKDSTGTGANSAGKGSETLEVTEFEITCYLANYKELEN